ncbi:MAG: hypothetical protein LBJ41_07560 [Treponema sp.]|jgi:hypothetical protein|nr:hypothetical protein [Treponema sp.]
MGTYKNVSLAVYCPAQWVAQATEQSLQEELAFFRRYVDIDKVYLETYRSIVAPKDKIELCKRFFTENNIAFAGGITTTCNDLSETDQKRQRLFNTFCYSNQAMRNHLKNMVEYTAEQFDEFIIDDFFFSQCRCEDCQNEKGKRTWEESKLAKMKEVSENLVLGPAKKVNPKVHVIIKYPNWVESFQETGYNPAEQIPLFDAIYTGTETRHQSQTDQHLPRYVSYSIMRFMENAAPGRNNGGWFDPYECYPIDCYLEQAYLTAFSKPRELMLFCWPSLFNNKVITPLGFRLHQIDQAMSQLGKPVGVPVYLPHNAQGEDHLEDYLGMLGIPFEPTPEFPEHAKTVFLTAQAVYDKDIIAKLTRYLNQGGKAIVTSGFVQASLDRGNDIKTLSSLRDRGRRIENAREYHITTPGAGIQPQVHRIAAATVSFPLLEHRNNASWSLMNAGNGSQHGSILVRDTFGKGELITLAVPDLFSDLQKLPEAALFRIRSEFQPRKTTAGDVLIELPEGSGAMVSLFIYDNKTFGLYSYTCGGNRVPDAYAPELVRVHIRASGTVTVIPFTGNTCSSGATSPVEETITPLYKNADEQVFDIRIDPGDFAFYQYR